MPTTALVLVLAAAVLHSTWNALTKRAHHHLCFLWLAVTLASVLGAPVALGILATGGLSAAALPFVAATIVLHALYFYALGRAYQSGELSVVYPIARGLGVALVPGIALVVFDEWPSPLGVAGVALVVLGIVALHLGPAWLTRSGWPPLGAGTWWAVATGLTTAAYSLVDKAGVHHMHPVPYITLMFVGMSLALLPVVLPMWAALRREWRTNWRSIVAASVMTLAAYLLVLFAFRLSKTAYVVAARETSIVLSALIGTLWFREGQLVARLAGAAVILGGVVCVALAR
ncbi:MAG TPA: DMT family transporter [Methylomirabilota bacterium]|nr:DMT family transporter [Methylomirabilota bacterium]